MKYYYIPSTYRGRRFGGKYYGGNLSGDENNDNEEEEEDVIMEDTTNNPPAAIGNDAKQKTIDPVQVVANLPQKEAQQAAQIITKAEITGKPVQITKKQLSLWESIKHDFKKIKKKYWDDLNPGYKLLIKNGTIGLVGAYAGKKLILDPYANKKVREATDVLKNDFNEEKKSLFKGYEDKIKNFEDKLEEAKKAERECIYENIDLKDKYGENNHFETNDDRIKKIYPEWEYNLLKKGTNLGSNISEMNKLINLKGDENFDLVFGPDTENYRFIEQLDGKINPADFPRITKKGNKIFIKNPKNKSQKEMYFDIEDKDIPEIRFIDANTLIIGKNIYDYNDLYNRVKNRTAEDMERAGYVYDNDEGDWVIPKKMQKVLFSNDIIFTPRSNLSHKKDFAKHKHVKPKRNYKKQKVIYTKWSTDKEFID